VLTAFLIGLFSALHCVGMCGSIIGSLTLSLKPEIRQQQSLLILYALFYSIGRIISYMLAGLLVGTLGQSIDHLFNLTEGLDILRIAAALLIIFLGLHIGGWFPQLAKIEQLGIPLWNRIKPYAQRLLPVSSLTQTLVFGMIWGWIPCGLVYSVLPLALASGSPIDAMLTMAAFGAGTLLPVTTTGILSGSVMTLRRIPHIQAAGGILLIMMGIWSLLLEL
jgi:sulfite exporter TauE/SafE